MKKYLVFPGEDKSQDGDIRYIGAMALIGLYWVSLDQCIFIYDEAELEGLNPDDFMHLCPREDGNYPHLNQEPA